MEDLDSNDELRRSAELAQYRTQCEISDSKEGSLTTRLLSCKTVPPDMITEFFAIVTDEVKAGNYNAHDEALLRIWLEELEIDWLMAIPFRYQRIPRDQIPRKYSEWAIKDLNVQEDILKITQYMQITKGRDGFYVKALAQRHNIIESRGLKSAMSTQKQGGFWSRFRRNPQT